MTTRDPAPLLGCTCKVTMHGHGRFAREILLPSNMCAEHKALYDEHRAAAFESPEWRADARAVLERQEWDQ